MNNVEQSKERLLTLCESEVEESTEEIRVFMTQQNGMVTKINTELEALKRQVVEHARSHVTARVAACHAVCSGRLSAAPHPLPFITRLLVRSAPSLPPPHTALQIENSARVIESAERAKDEARTTLERYRATENVHKGNEKDCGELIMSLSVTYTMSAQATAAAVPMATRGREAVQSLQRVLNERQRALAESKERYRAQLNAKSAALQEMKIKQSNCSKEAGAKEDEARARSPLLRHLT